ncbi:MAG TPA: hypothetical protein VF950_05000 [Planctomycetota bacterium]
MPGDDQDLLFGRIAIELGFCVAAQVEACLALQAQEADGMSLGRHLVREGHLTEDQHSRVLERQRLVMHRKRRAPGLTKDDLLFGRSAVREGLATVAQVKAALQEQSKRRDGKGIGEVLRTMGVLNAAEVEWILGLQSKWIMGCPTCFSTFTVRSTSRTPGKANCPRCKVPLRPRESKTAAIVEAEVDTSVRQPLPKAARGPGTCRICGKSSLSAPGKDGLVECLSCRVRFKPGS